MELASMLAGERFTDQPQSVSPVINRFLRADNDLLDDERRPQLYGYAARVVGTGASRAVERTRSRLCVEWLLARDERVPWMERKLPGPLAAARAVKSAVRDGSDSAHRSLLTLLDELIACGDSWLGIPVDAAELAANTLDFERYANRERK